jgi:hypothetical protein
MTLPRLVAGLVLLFTLGTCLSPTLRVDLSEEADAIQQVLPPQGTRPHVLVSPSANGRRVEVLYAHATADSLAWLDGTPASDISEKSARRVGLFLKRFYEDVDDVTTVEVGVGTRTELGGLYLSTKTTRVLKGKELQRLGK